MNNDWKALRAVFIKNWKVSLVEPWALLTILFWPALDVLTMGYISLYVNRELWNLSQVGGIGYVQFMITGAVFWSFVNVTIMEISQLWTRERWQETLRFIFRLPIKRWVLLLSNTLFGVSRAFIATIIAWFISLISFSSFISVNLLHMALLLFLTIASVYGISIVIATLGLFKREVGAFSMALIWLLNLFSGIYYPLPVLPVWMQTIGKAFPIYYAVESLRAVSVYGRALSEISDYIVALVFFSIVLTIFGFLAFNHVEKRVRGTGEIGEH